MGQPCPQDLADTYALAFRGSRPWGVEEFEAYLHDPQVHILGTKNSFVITRIIAGEGEILTLATHPQFRRMGLARQMLGELFTYMQGQGVGAVFLEVAADNTAALALYTKFGFHKIGQRAGYYKRKNGPAIDALILRKDIDPCAP